jgi:hypothetical protein
MSEDDLNRLADALRGLAPDPTPLDRDALMYRAGRNAARGVRLWQAAAALSTAAALALGLVLGLRPEPQAVTHTVVVTVTKEVPVPVESSPPAPERQADGFFVGTPAEPVDRPLPRRLEEQVLRWGLDGLPLPPPATPREAPSMDELLKSL